jgi:hypothetical protein
MHMFCRDHKTPRMRMQGLHHGLGSSYASSHVGELVLDGACTTNASVIYFKAPILLFYGRIHFHLHVKGQWGRYGTRDPDLD